MHRYVPPSHAEEEEILDEECSDDMTRRMRKIKAFLNINRKNPLS